MLFNSFVFIVFYFPIVVVGFFWLGYLSHKLAAGWLTLASLVFYGYWDCQYIPLLLSSIGFNFLTAQKIGLSTGLSRKCWLIFAIVLAYFCDLSKSAFTWLFQVCRFFSKFNQLNCRL